MSSVETIKLIKELTEYVETLEEKIGSNFGGIQDFMENVEKRIGNIEEKVFGEVQSSTVTIRVPARRNRSTRRNRSCKH
jgi:hypothetical protein